uniref:HTH psq-type domain-containing protein n=1 Tax=Timema genevievae TaxID=629358 RepID=A0A7R9JWK9_TIMGE|nr:unnamed protein product [Timema genevievae]
MSKEDQMVRTWVRKTNSRNWDDTKMIAAMHAVREQHMSCNMAAITYEIPEATLRRYLKTEPEQKDQQEIVHAQAEAPARGSESNENITVHTSIPTKVQVTLNYIKPLPRAKRSIKRKRPVITASVLTSTPVKDILVEKEQERENKLKKKEERDAKTATKKLFQKTKKAQENTETIKCPGCEEEFIDPPNEDWLVNQTSGLHGLRCTGPTNSHGLTTCLLLHHCTNNKLTLFPHGQQQVVSFSLWPQVGALLVPLVGKTLLRQFDESCARELLSCFLVLRAMCRGVALLFPSSTSHVPWNCSPVSWFDKPCAVELLSCFLVRRAMYRGVALLSTSHVPWNCSPVSWFDKPCAVELLSCFLVRRAMYRGVALLFPGLTSHVPWNCTFTLHWRGAEVTSQKLEPRAVTLFEGKKEEAMRERDLSLMSICGGGVPLEDPDRRGTENTCVYRGGLLEDKDRRGTKNTRVYKGGIVEDTDRKGTKNTRVYRGGLVEDTDRRGTKNTVLWRRDSGGSRQERKKNTRVYRGGLVEDPGRRGTKNTRDVLEDSIWELRRIGQKTELLINKARIDPILKFKETTNQVRLVEFNGDREFGAQNCVGYT